MLSNGKAHAVVGVKSLEAAKAFYEGTLGLTNGFAIPGATMYPCSDGTLFLVYETTYEPGGTTAAGFLVKDFDAVAADLRAKGVKFEEYEGFDMVDGIMSMDTPDGTMKSAWFKDPDGNTLAISSDAAPASS